MLRLGCGSVVACVLSGYMPRNFQPQKYLQEKSLVSDLSLQTGTKNKASSSLMKISNYHLNYRNQNG